MAISDYEKTIYNMRSVPVKRTKEVEERLMTALQIATSQLRVIIGQEDEPMKVRAYQEKRMKVVQMMNELGISLKRDITSAISDVVNDVASTEQDATNDLLLENDDADLMVDFTEIPRQTIDALAQRYDTEGLRISSNIWAQAQIGEIENAVLSGIARGQSAKAMSDQLTQFILGGGTGMGTSVQAKAMRLARTEINNAYWESARRSSDQSPVVGAVKWQLSGRHPEYDVCNLLAESSVFQLGPGVYPPEYLPPKPHPNCLCYQKDLLRSPSLWEKPKKAYTDAELTKALTTALHTETPSSATGSKGFKEKQLQIFKETVSNVVRKGLPGKAVSTAFLEAPDLPPDTPVATLYNMFLEGGRSLAERLDAGFVKKRETDIHGFYTGKYEWRQDLTDSEIGYAQKIGSALRSDAIPISVNIPISEPKVFKAMLKSGRSKNLFETGRGYGSANKERRAGWEASLVSEGLDQRDEAEGEKLYDEMPPRQKPSYGALNLGDDPKGAASQYGKAYFEMEPHVKNRSTFTPNNSSQTSQVSTFRNAETFSLSEEGREYQGSVDANRKDPTKYIEVQIWNGFDFKKDVKALHINRSVLNELKKVPDFWDAKTKSYRPDISAAEYVDVDWDLRDFSDKYDVELVVHEDEDTE